MMKDIEEPGQDGEPASPAAAGHEVKESLKEVRAAVLHCRRKSTRGSGQVARGQQCYVIDTAQQ